MPTDDGLANLKYEAIPGLRLRGWAAGSILEAG